MLGCQKFQERLIWLRSILVTLENELEVDTGHKMEKFSSLDRSLDLRCVIVIIQLYGF